MLAQSGPRWLMIVSDRPGDRQFRPGYLPAEGTPRGLTDQCILRYKLRNANLGGLMSQDILNTWKQIEKYLGKSRNTCHRYEEQGLPIRRIDGKKRSPVFALKSELDDWWLKNSSKIHEHSAAKLSGRKFSLLEVLRKSKVWLIVPAAAAVLFVLISLGPDKPPGQAADFALAGSRLIVKSESGQVLWRNNLGTGDHMSENEYRKFQDAQRNAEGGQIHLTLISFLDINRDGQAEILFGLKTKEDTSGGALYCFGSQKEEPLWVFRPGRELANGLKRYSGEYRISGFVLIDRGPNEDPMIVVVAIHFPSSLCELAVLDSAGRKRGAFYNYGHFSDVIGIDLNDDGRKEIVAAGQNDIWQKACLAVFDIDEVRGQSPAMNEGDRFSGIEPGSEKYYILLPGIDWEPKKALQETITSITRKQGNGIRILTQISRLYFDFASDLGVAGITVSDAFLNEWIDARGKVKIEDYARTRKGIESKLRNEMLYWDGSLFLNTVTHN